MRLLLNWLKLQRASTRFGFVLQILCRVLFSVFSLLWTPLLLSSMGRNLNGLFLSFQKLANLGIIGDLGMGGLINIRTSRLLGQGKERELSAFLSATRGAYLLLAGAIAAIFLAVSPPLLRALRFAGDPAVGSLGLLSGIGAAAMVMVIFNGYITNLNQGCGNVVWPAVPFFLSWQAATLGHLILALHHAPLWMQYAPYVGAAIVQHGLGWLYVRVSYPELARVRPMRFAPGELFTLGAQSFWAYLSVIGTGIYTATDSFLLSAGFGPEWVPVYFYNMKLSELALFVAYSASQASLPKLTQWIASSDPQTRQRGIEESLRLNRFQTFLGCCAAYLYLSLNDRFVGLWLGKSLHAPLAWQAAFACTLGANAAGMMGADLASRCSEQGIRVSGLCGLLSSLLNFVLAFAAMKARSVLGIAVAMTIAMSAQELCMGWYSGRQLGISWWRLSLRNWCLALVFVGLALLMRTEIVGTGVWAAAGRIGFSLVVLLAAAWLTGIRSADFRHEFKIFQGMIRNAH